MGFSVKLALRAPSCKTGMPLIQDEIYKHMPIHTGSEVREEKATWHESVPLAPSFML